MKKKNKTQNNKSGNGIFEINGVITFCMLMLANILGVIFQIAEGRIINDPVQYADLNSLLSFQAILTLPVAAITMIVTRYVAQYGLKDVARIAEFLRWILKPVLVMALSIVVLGVIFSNQIDQYLHINMTVYVIEIVISAGVGILSAISMGGLQGMQLFFLYGVLGLVGPISKIIAVIISSFTYNKIGVTLFIMIIGNAATVVVGLWMLKTHLPEAKQKKWDGEISELIHFSLFSFILNVAMTVISNLDLFLVKHYFNEEAGFYSTALVLGKIVTYFTAAIVVVLLPLAIASRNNRSVIRSLFHKSMLYCSILSGVCILVLEIMGKWMIGILYGSKYMGSAMLLIPVTIMILPTAYLSIMMNFCVARDKKEFITVTLLMAGVIEILITVARHTTMENVIMQIAIVLWTVMVTNWFKIEYDLHGDTLNE